MVVNMIAERSESLNDKVPELNYFGGNLITFHLFRINFIRRFNSIMYLCIHSCLEGFRVNHHRHKLTDEPVMCLCIDFFDSDSRSHGCVIARRKSSNSLKIEHRPIEISPFLAQKSMWVFHTPFTNLSLLGIYIETENKNPFLFWVECVWRGEVARTTQIAIFSARNKKKHRNICFLLFRNHKRSICIIIFAFTAVSRRLMP